MRELTLIVTDLYIAPETRAALADSSGAREALPVLELLLARAGERRPQEWRALACEIAQVPATSAVPVAALTRASGAHRAAQPGDRAQYWLASPVHLVAALDHVQLSEVLSLGQDEWREIVSGFNAEFAG